VTHDDMLAARDSAQGDWETLTRLVDEAEQRYLDAAHEYERAYPWHGPQPEPTVWEQMLHNAYDAAIEASLERIWKSVTV
jgi:hypothetical protein